MLYGAALLVRLNCGGTKDPAMPATIKTGAKIERVIRLSFAAVMLVSSQDFEVPVAFVSDKLKSHLQKWSCDQIGAVCRKALILPKLQLGV